MNTGSTGASRWVVVCTSVPNGPKARGLALAAVRERLAACVQWMPIRSAYWWKGRVETASEYLLLAKTRRGHARALMTFWASRHPYEVPELVVLPIVDGAPAYLRWLERETAGPRTQA